MEHQRVKFEEAKVKALEIITTSGSNIEAKVQLLSAGFKIKTLSAAEFLGILEYYSQNIIGASEDPREALRVFINNYSWLSQVKNPITTYFIFPPSIITDTNNQVYTPRVSS